MSTQVSNNTFKAYLGNEELLRDRQKTQPRTNKTKDQSRKVVIESSHNRYFTDGVRAPLLSDIHFRQSCRLDVVRSPKHSKSRSSVSPESPGRKTVIPQIIYEKENSNISFSEKSHSIKSIRYLLPNGSFRSESEPQVTTRSVSDLENKWKRCDSRTSDARDVLYRNTYSDTNKKLRYHTMTLPSIASQNKAIPRVTKPKSPTKKKTIYKDVEASQTKLKDPGIIETKGVIKREQTPEVEVGFLKVQKIKSHFDDPPKGEEDLYLTVRQPTDIYSQTTNYPLVVRTERPLKYETIGPHGSRLHRKHSSLRNMLPYSVRDYKSAEAYKEYLENVKNKMELHGSTSARLDREISTSQFGRENRVLQSVIDVNIPKERTGPRSNDSKSLVIEIKPTWNEISNGYNDDLESEIDLGLNACPTNTPALD